MAPRTRARAFLSGLFLAGALVLWLAWPTRSGTSPAALAPRAAEPAAGARAASAPESSADPRASDLLEAAAAAVPAAGASDANGRGAVELTFVDEHGEPVAGVSAILLPLRLDGGPWSASWHDEIPALERVLRRERSGDDGRIRWGDLPPAAGYQWGLLSEHLVETDPAYVAPQTLTSPPSLPVDVSGPFAVSEGETTFLRARVLGAASIVGRLDVPPGSKPGRVELVCERQQDLVHAVCTTEEDGSFRFDSVRPGLVAVYAGWEAAPQELCFASAAVEARAGEEHDVGLLKARPTVEVRGEVEIRMNSCTEARWIARPLLTRQGLFGGEVALPCSLDLRMGPARFPYRALTKESIEASALASFEVRLDLPFVIRGLPSADGSVRARRIGDWTNPREPCLKVRDVYGSELRRESVPRELFVEISVEGGRRVQLVPGEGGEILSQRADLFAFASDGAQRVSASVGERFTNRGSLLPVVCLPLLDGHYQVLLLAHDELYLDVAYARTELAIDMLIPPDDSVVTQEIELLPATMLVCRVVDQEGLPVPERHVELTLAEFRPGSDDDALWIHQALTDFDGIFAIFPVVPESELVVRGSSARIRTPRVGEREVVDVVLER